MHAPEVCAAALYAQPAGIINAGQFHTHMTSGSRITHTRCLMVADILHI